MESAVNRIIEHTRQAMIVANELCDYEKEPDLWKSKVYDIVSGILYEEAGLSYNKHYEIKPNNKDSK